MPASRLTGSRIREQRLINGVRQADLARAAGISASYLNLIEHNRRRIGGKLLANLARELGVETSGLAEGAETVLLDQLSTAAATARQAEVELARTDEFAGRFRGWAGLVVEQHDRITELEARIAALSDRMTHDPLLARSLHDVISSVTSIRSTSSILVNGEDLDSDWQRRFHSNLYDDSVRLAESSQSLVDYLEQSQDAGGAVITPLEDLEAYLEEVGFAFPILEQGGVVADVMAEPGVPQSEAVRVMLVTYLARYKQDARALPLSELRTDESPGVTAARLNLPFALVLRRRAAAGGTVGMVRCDGSGALTLHKQIAGFAMPRLGAACALWPIFEALSRPMVPVRKTVDVPGTTRQQFVCHAIAEPKFTGDFDAPQVLEAVMLIEPAQKDANATPIGTSCRICPREPCPARRETSILR